MTGFLGASLDRLYNLHWVAKGVARSAQPYLGFYKMFLKGHGFRSLINLRGKNPRYAWWRQEVRICEDLGITRYEVKLNSRNLPAREVLVDLFDAFAAAQLPILIKCSGGQDRTSLAAALYLLHKQGAGARDAAQAQFAAWPYLHLPKRHQNWLKLFPQFALEDARGTPLLEWARMHYDPQALEAWLDAHGASQTYRATQQLKRKPPES